MKLDIPDLVSLADVISFFSKDCIICVHDLAGFLNSEKMLIKRTQEIHSTDFCNYAKSTQSGESECMKCKAKCNFKAITEKNIFSGRCFYGLFEVVKPVVFDNTTVSIIYIGNMVDNEQAYVEKLTHACSKTGVDPEKLLKLGKKAVRITDPQYYYELAEVIASYIKLLYYYHNKKLSSSNVVSSDTRIKALDIAEYIHSHYDNRITLKDLTKKFYIHEKTLGRILKKHFQITFHEYLNRIRLEHSLVLLETTNMSILDISIDCGFNNVTYFNKCFKANYGFSPSKFRKTITPPSKSGKTK